jgi:hypothetical protein
VVGIPGGVGEVAVTKGNSAGLTCDAPAKASPLFSLGSFSGATSSCMLKLALPQLWSNSRLTKRMEMITFWYGVYMAMCFGMAKIKPCSSYGIGYGRKSSCWRLFRKPLTHGRDKKKQNAPKPSL